MWLIVGLGNPGPEYEANRHNIGFAVVDELAKRVGLASAWRSKFGGALCQGEIGGQKVVLLKPMKFMNVSGEVVQPAAGFFQIPPERTVVVHDELDLDFARLQVKVGGGAAGHNGLRSIAERLGTPEFVRVRVGIGKPTRGSGADYVLGNFSKVEQKELPIVVAEATDATETIVKDGAVVAMNRYNRKKD